MNNVETTGIKWMERKWSLFVTLAALIVSYPLLLFLVDKGSAPSFFLIGLPAALGILVACLAVKKLKIDESSVLHKYHFHTQTLTYGTGGPLAGLLFLFLTCRQSTCLRYDSCEAFFGFIVVILPLFGQIIWLIWPLVVLRAIFRKHVKLVGRCDVAEAIIILCGCLGLVPGMGFLFYYFLYGGIDSLVCR